MSFFFNQIRQVRKFKDALFDETREFMKLDKSGDAIDEVVAAAEATIKKYKFNKKHTLALILGASAKAGGLLKEAAE